MKKFLYSHMFTAMYCLGFVITSYAQLPADSAAAAQQHSFGNKGLFENDELLEITLNGNIRELLNDRSEDSKYHSLHLSYKNEDSNKITLPVKMKTRGNFRRLKKNCIYPPLFINFSKSDSLKASVFRKQNKLKLVMPCRTDDYVIREWLVYKLYNLLTPNSLRARLVTVKLEDTQNKKTTSSFYGILLEDEDDMAERNGLICVNKKVQFEQTDRNAFLTMTVFEYLIGNTDWSVQYQHNIKLIAKDSNAIPVTVPYDFDHAGIVNAPYALPAEELELASVRQRLYRGLCIKDMQEFNSVITLYNNHKKDIYSTYTNCALLDKKYIKSTVGYLDEFYETINNPAAVKKQFRAPCDAIHNLIIKGLKEDQ